MGGGGERTSSPIWEEHLKGRERKHTALTYELVRLSFINGATAIQA